MPYTIDHSGKLRWINDAPRLRFTFPGAYRALHAYAIALRHGHDCDMAARYALYCAETTWHGPTGWRLLDLKRGRWMTSNRIEASFDRFNRLLCNTFPYSKSSNRRVDKWQYADGVDAIYDIILATPIPKRNASMNLHVSARHAFTMLSNDLKLWTDVSIYCRFLSITGPVMHNVAKNHAHDCIVKPSLARQWVRFSRSWLYPANHKAIKSILTPEKLVACANVKQLNSHTYEMAVVDDNWSFDFWSSFYSLKTFSIAPAVILSNLIQTELEEQGVRPIGRATIYERIIDLGEHMANTDSIARGAVSLWKFLVHQTPKGLDTWLARQSDEHTWEKDSALNGCGD
jgi:hypothetical protein